MGCVSVHSVAERLILKLKTDVDEVALFSSKHMDLYTLTTEETENPNSDLSLPKTQWEEREAPDQLGVIDSMTPESLKLEIEIFSMPYGYPALLFMGCLLYLSGIIVILLVSGLSFSGQAT